MQKHILIVYMEAYRSAILAKLLFSVQKTVQNQIIQKDYIWSNFLSIRCISPQNVQNLSWNRLQGSLQISNFSQTLYFH